MSTHEAAHRLAAFLNELSAEGISVEAGAFGVLCLSSDTDSHFDNVLPPDATDPAWMVETQ